MKNSGGQRSMTDLYNLCHPILELRELTHKLAEHDRQERARQAAEDKTESYEIIEYAGIQYIRKFINDSLQMAETWNDRLKSYNELFVDYLERKSYELKMQHKPSHYALSFKEYKKIIKYELSLKEQK